MIAPTLQYERDDVTALMDGFAAYPRPFIQYTPPVVRPSDDVISESEFFIGLARRLGLQLTFKKLIAGMSFDDVPGGHEVDLQSPPSAQQMVRWWCEGTQVDADELLSHAGEPRLLDMEPAQVQPGPESGARLQLCPDDVATELAALHAQVAEAAYPYRLATRRLLESLNSAYHKAAFTRQRHGTVYACLNPQDMAREGLEDGDTAEIRSAHGHVLVRVKGEAALRTGVVSLPHLWGDVAEQHGLEPCPDSAFSGRLVSLEHDVQLINRMPIQTGIPVQVRAWAAHMKP